MWIQSPFYETALGSRIPRLVAPCDCGIPTTTWKDSWDPRRPAIWLRVLNLIRCFSEPMPDLSNYGISLRIECSIDMTSGSILDTNETARAGRPAAHLS